jgi:MYXO-CTERM domain-containing protein
MKQRRHRRPRPLLLALAALLASALVGLAGPAQAHDELISTNPKDQAQVPTVPDAIVLTFAEPAEQVGSQVIVRGPGGNVAQGQPVFSQSTVTQAVQAGAPAGSYTVLWRVTSDDGHPVSGRFTFTAAAASTASATSSPTSGSAAATTAADPTSSSSGSGGSSAPRGLWLLVLIALLVPVAIFIRRRPGGPHDASPGRSKDQPRLRP